MSSVVNRRKYLEAANALAKASNPDIAMVKAAMKTLEVVICDLTGQNAVLVLAEIDAKGVLKLGDQE